MGEVSLVLYKKFSKQFEVSNWLQILKGHVRFFKHAIHHSKLSIKTLQKLQTNLGHLRRLQLLLKSKCEVGRRVNRNISDRIQWVELPSFFQNRIRQGLILNKVRKDILMFLEDVFYVSKLEFKILNRVF